MLNRKYNELYDEVQKLEKAKSLWEASRFATIIREVGAFKEKAREWAAGTLLSK
jgi:hypothetical protein